MIKDTAYRGFFDVTCDSCGQKSSLNFFCRSDETFADAYTRSLESHRWRYKPEILPNSEWTTCPNCSKLVMKEQELGLADAICEELEER